MTPEETKKVMSAMSKELEFLQRVKSKLEIENSDLKRRIAELERGRPTETSNAENTKLNSAEKAENNG